MASQRLVRFFGHDGREIAWCYVSRCVSTTVAYEAARAIREAWRALGAKI